MQLATDTGIRVGAGLSTQRDGLNAARSALDSALASLDGAAPDLVCLFVAPQFESEQRAILELVAHRTGGAAILGCSAGGVIGGAIEVEDAPAVSMWAAKLPGASLRPFRLTFEREDDHAIIEGLEEMPPAGENPTLLLFADGYSFPADLLLDHLNEKAPGLPVVGGMASGGLEAGRNALFLDDQILHDGAIGAMLTGPIATRAFVSQGCRPVGRTYAVTRSEQNVIFELGGEPALRRVEELFAVASPRDQLLMRRGLHVGQAISELKPELLRGDFLIRNVVGIDQDSGAIAIADMVEVGQTVQFQVRDAESAREDLKVALEQERAADERPVAGVLLFSCNGRGQAMFGQPSHDIGAVKRAFGNVPVAGFFAAGEFGPVGDRNFVHGFTASMLVVRGS
jgi:small ligand-binding sensory domain FIST